MINKECIILLKRQVNEGSIFIDEYSDTFMLKMHTHEGGCEFYSIPPELTGYFSPLIVEDKECYSFCHGQLTLNDSEIIRCGPVPAKLKKVSSCKYLNIENHGNDLLSTIFFINFQYGKRSFGGVPYINYLIEVVMHLVEKADIKEELILKAALLNDLVDTTHVKLESIEMQFGSEVRGIVESLGRLNYQEHNDKELMMIVNDIGEKACKIELAILITNLEYIRTAHEESQQEQYETFDKLADFCEGSSPILHHCYMVERTEFS